MNPSVPSRPWSWVVVTLVMFSLLPHLAWGQPSGTRVTGFKAGREAGRARFVVELSGARRPVWQVSYRAADGSVLIDLRDLDGVDAVLPPCAGDPVLKSWSLARPNFRQAVWTVRLAWPVPADHVTTQVLSNPTRVVVDVARGFQEDLRLRVTRHVSWKRQEVRTDSGGYVLLNELEVEYPSSDVSVGLVHARDSLKATEKPSAMATRTNVLALVNGGFFARSGGPLGVVVDQGRVLSPHVAKRPPRTVLGLTRSGRVIMGRVAVQDSRLVPVDGSGDWSDVVVALGGGPRLVKGGRLHLTTDEEGLGKNGNNITRPAGRTAVATLANGHLLLVTVSGYRDNHSEGWTLPEMAQWLVRRGAVDAMGLDGGGSTAMVVQGQIISRSAVTRYERPVANALALVDRSPVLLPARVQVTASLRRARADGEQVVRVVAAVEDGSGRPAPDGTRVYFACTTGTITANAITSGGRAVGTWRSAREPGEARVYAFAGLTWGESTIQVEAGPAAHLAARVVKPRPLPVSSAAPSPSAVPAPTPTPVVATTPRVEILVTDAWYNALEGQEVRVEVTARGGDKQVVVGRTGPEGLVGVSVPGLEGGGEHSRAPRRPASPGALPTLTGGEDRNLPPGG